MMAELVRILDKLLKEHFTHAEDRQEKRTDEDYDEVRFLLNILRAGFDFFI